MPTPFARSFSQEIWNNWLNVWSRVRNRVADTRNFWSWTEASDSDNKCKNIADCLLTPFDSERTLRQHVVTKSNVIRNVQNFHPGVRSFLEHKVNRFILNTSADCEVNLVFYHIDVDSTGWQKELLKTGLMKIIEF